MCHNRRVNFAGELDVVQTFLTERGFPMAVIGGVALAAYGHPRLTLDLDIITEAAAQDGLVAMMASIGRKCVGTSCARASRTSGVSSPHRTDAQGIDLERDVPTTPEDIAVLR